MSGLRSFGALVAHDGVSLIEYRAERAGLRIVEQWSDTGRSASIDEALARLASLVDTTGARRPQVALALEQFGVMHHLMTLPPATDEVLVPIVKREVQRVFGVADPVVSFSRGASQERRDPARADERTAPKQLFVAAAPRPTIDALTALTARGIRIEIATAVPKAIHSLYSAAGASLEPTAVLVCLESGPHLSFFLDGRLELAIDPPIALEGDRPSVPTILDQVERGAVYFRQQFRGASATRLLLAARADEYDALAAALEARLGAPVKPLFAGASSPEAVIAIGAVLESRSATPLDLFPHPATASDRIAALVRGPNAIASGAVAAALVAGLWGGSQVLGLANARRENDRLRAAVSGAIPTVAPMRQVAQRRADLARQVEFVRGTLAERSAVARALASIGATAAEGVTFDSVRVARSGEGWAGVIGGRAQGRTTSQTVYALDAFLKSVRRQPMVTAANLDNFDYMGGSDSTHASGGVGIQFHLSFAMKASEGKP